MRKAVVSTPDFRISDSGADPNRLTVNYLLKAPLFLQIGFLHLFMDPIPISFKHNGVTYSDCYFTKIVRTSEESFWHLYDNDNYYLGKLRFNNKWTFDANKRTGIDQLAEFFGDYVEKSNRNNAA